MQILKQALQETVHYQCKHNLQNLINSDREETPYLSDKEFTPSMTKAFKKLWEEIKLSMTEVFRVKKKKVEKYKKECIS